MLFPDRRDGFYLIANRLIQGEAGSAGPSARQRGRGGCFARLCSRLNFFLPFPSQCAAISPPRASHPLRNAHQHTIYHLHSGSDIDSGKGLHAYALSVIITPHLALNSHYMYWRTGCYNHTASLPPKVHTRQVDLSHRLPSLR